MTQTSYNMILNMLLSQVVHIVPCCSKLFSYVQTDKFDNSSSNDGDDDNDDDGDDNHENDR